jgi:pimeloyl-ACP methyl ester carboxylesterase
VIAYERFGGGHPLILVGGALRSPVVTTSLAERLAPGLAVYTYDRRGRGDSGDTPPYAVEREVDDLAALIEQAGGTASVYGHSSGAGLALRAAARGLPISRLVLHDVPFAADDSDRRGARELDGKIRRLLAEDRRRDAVEMFLTSLGLPPEVAGHLSGDPALPAVAHTLPYDFAVMDDASDTGGQFLDLAADVTVPTLVLSSRTGPDGMTAIGRRVADALPNGAHRLLEAHDPIITPDALAPDIEAFLATAPPPAQP